MIDAITKLRFGLGYGFFIPFVEYLTVMYKIVIPIKDLLIALSFAYLYYYQGMKKTANKSSEKEDKDMIK